MAALEGELLTYEATMEAAQRELAWFYGELRGSFADREERVRRAAEAIEGTLCALRPPERGALALRYTRREWPALVHYYYGAWASLVVRLECALHDWDGRSATPELEERAAARLEAHLRGPRAPALVGLSYRAKGYCRQALQAYVALRGRFPCLVPEDAPPSEGMAAE